jgi:hypothetical protein
MGRRAGASSQIMHHAIRPGLHYARAGGRTLFLDLRQNRYFAITPAAEPDIARLENGDALAPDSPLISAGLVIPSNTPFMPPTRPAVPQASLLDTCLRPGPALVLSLVGKFAWARSSLALMPRSVLPREANGHLDRYSPDDETELRRIAGAYRTASHVVGAHDQCLAWSLALTRLCRRRGHAAHCLLGVASRPFSAHAWVQSGDHLLNDRYDFVRNFTPILVL